MSTTTINGIEIETTKDCGLHDLTLHQFFSNGVDRYRLIGDLASGAASVEQQREAAELLEAMEGLMRKVDELDGERDRAESDKDKLEDELAMAEASRDESADEISDLKQTIQSVAKAIRHDITELLEAAK